MSVHCGVGTQDPTCTSVELATASGFVLSQSKPGSQFTILLGSGLGAKWRKKDAFFFLQWQLVGLEPVIFGLTVKCFNHLATVTYVTHTYEHTLYTHIYM